MWNQLKTIALLGLLAAIAVGIVSYLTPGWALAAMLLGAILASLLRTPTRTAERLVS